VQVPTRSRPRQETRLTATLFRWLLTLVAFLMPAAVSCRDVSTGSEPGAKPETAEVVFRHYV